jgi:hypothetical protein
VSTILKAEFLTPPPGSQPQAVSYPDLGDEYFLPRALRLPEDRSLVQLPQPRTFNSLSRTGLMLNAVGLAARAAIDPQVQIDPFSVGIYCAIENGPDDYRSVVQMLTTPAEDFAAKYKSLRSPKQHFKLLTNVPASQLAIFLGINGPLNVFNSSRHAVDQALDQADFDLYTGQIALAVVCTGFSIEDPLIAMRSFRDASPDSILSEGAACLVLAADGVRTNWTRAARSPSSWYFGISNSLVHLQWEAGNDGSIVAGTAAAPEFVPALCERNLCATLS